MNNFRLHAAVTCAAVLAVSPAVPANAATVSAALPASASLAAGNSAAELISALQMQGYSVQINGTADVPLTQCRVTGVHGIPDVDPGGVHALRFTTVYVDVACASDN